MLGLDVPDFVQATVGRERRKAERREGDRVGVALERASGEDGLFVQDEVLGPRTGAVDEVASVQRL